MPRPRLLFASTLVILTAGCGQRYRTELVGHGQATATARGGVPQAATAGTMRLPQGTYDLAIRFDIPRAQLIDWKLECPGVALDGQVGEPMAQYRERRLAEIRAEHERIARELAAAPPPPPRPADDPPPPLQARARVHTPVGTITVQGEARPPTPDADPGPGPVQGEVIAHGAPALSPADTGRGSLAAKVRIETSGDGVCGLHVIADDPEVRAAFQVTRIRDLRAEARAREVTSTKVAVMSRGQLTAQLLANGADASARARRHAAGIEARRAQAAVEAEARLAVEARTRSKHEAEDRARRERDLQRQERLDAEARTRWEAGAGARAQAGARARRDAEAIHARELVKRWLVGRCGADPGRLQRERHERQARVHASRLEAEAHRRRVRREREARDERQQRVIEQRRAAEAQIVGQREAAALRARDGLRGYLVAFGAVARPPRPLPLPEDPGAPPFAGAAWSAGHWTWRGRAWQWNAGGWTDATTFGDAGGEVTIRVGLPSGVTLPIGAPPPRRPRERVRDHRDRDEPPVRVRDHRSAESTEPAWTPREGSPAKVRDHREEDSRERRPRVRR